MTRLAMTVASWPVTWVLFGLVAWGGAGLLITAAVCRINRAPADGDLGYDTAQAMLRGRGTLTEAEWDVLLDLEGDFR